jgi:osmoprotectant transport system permease protein
VLDDPRHALPPYDAVILVSPARANDRRLLDALRPLVGSIPVTAMRAANYSVDRDTDKRTPAQAAADLARGVKG